MAENLHQVNQFVRAGPPYGRAIDKVVARTGPQKIRNPKQT